MGRFSRKCVRPLFRPHDQEGSTHRASPNVRGCFMRITATVVLTCLCANVPGPAYQAGQASSRPTTKATKAPRFDVVSVKPCPNTYHGGVTASPGRLRLQCFTVEELIRETAFGGRTNVLPHEAAALVKGGPAWVRSTRFTIEGTTEEPSTTGETSGLLIQDVLKRRFKLTVSEELHALPVYDLIQAQGGAKLQPAKDGSCFQTGPGKAPAQFSSRKAPVPICGGFGRSPAGGVDVSGITMSDFCKRMSYALDRDVIDKTGIEGMYNFHLETTLDELSLFNAQRVSSPPMPDAPIPDASEPGGSLFTAVRKVGLRLTRSTSPGRLVIIDHVEMPDAN